MKKNSVNKKSKSILSQLQLTFPADTLQPGIHAVGIKEDYGMTRIYTANQPHNTNHHAAINF